MKRGESTLTQQGQLTVPAAVRRRAKLAPGMRVRWSVSESGVVSMHPIRLSTDQIVGAFKSKSLRVSNEAVEKAIRDGYDSGSA
jgi:bifunctional DNA-binding transcriptional regulator/antitoxin component of YhaV-PrlF toxin-antitoxin module